MDAGQVLHPLKGKWTEIMGHKIPQNASSFQWSIDTISIVGKCFQSKSSKFYITFADILP